MEEQQKSVKLGEIIQEFNLEILRTAPDYENVPLRALDINRPGLPLTGFFEHFDTERLLLIGLTENTYLAGLTSERRRESFDRLLSSHLRRCPVPALVGLSRKRVSAAFLDDRIDDATCRVQQTHLRH